MNPPARVGAFALERELGRGGMGSVWLARRAGSEALYALKLIPLSSDEEIVERFRREGEAMARVRAHPHLTQVHALVEDGPWLGLALEYCPGGDLEGRLRQGPLEPGAARDLIRALSEGLEVAHAAGILHRDLKPANVIFDEANRPKLTDFGLAKLHDRQSLTLSGALLGTPSYMAPEQATTGECDPRTDVYGLGGILYHCLSGAPPFAGGSVLAVLDQVISNPPPPLPASVPPDLARACLRALAKSPEDRFPDMASFRTALSEGALSPGPSRGLLIGAALFALVLSGGYLLHAALRPRPEPNPAPTASATRPAPTPTPATPSRVVPGLLPWRDSPPRQPDRPGSFRLLGTLAKEARLVYPATFARHQRWRITTPERLHRLTRRHSPIVEPSLKLRAYEAGLPSLAGLGFHLAGRRPNDGFARDRIGQELFLLGLLRNGDPGAKAELASYYRDVELGPLRERLERSESDVQAWRALGLRAHELLDAQRPRYRLEEVMPRANVRPFLRAAWAELSPQSAYTFQLGLGLPKAGIETIEELELRAAAMGAVQGGDAGLLVSATCAGGLTSARSLARLLLERPGAAEQAVGRALCAVTYLAADGNMRRAMAAGGELSRAGLEGPSGSDQDRLEERLSAVLSAAGLLGPHPASRLRELPEAPPGRDAQLDVPALLEEFLPEAPVLQCLWREVLLGGKSPQAVELREALGSKGLSSLKHLTKSLGDENSSYYDPVLATRLSLRVMLGGRRGTAMILYLNIERSQESGLAELLSACLGLSARFDDDAQAQAVPKTSKHKDLQVLDFDQSWAKLRAYEEALARRPFRAASRRVGPPPQLSIERLVQATASTYVQLRWLQRISYKHYHAEVPTEGLYERAMGRDTLRLRLLAAAFRRGDLRALVPLLETHAKLRENLLLSSALIQFLLSAETGPVSERESWRFASEALRRTNQGRLGGVLDGLRRDPTREDLWRAFYLARERTWFKLGLPAQPELGAWGTPRELLGER